MNKQLIIDIISYILCAKQYKTIVIVSNTTREAIEFFNEFINKLPDYVGITNSNLGFYKTSMNSTIICTHQNSRAMKGRALELMVILSNVDTKKKKELLYNYSPCGNVVIEE